MKNLPAKRLISLVRECQRSAVARQVLLVRTDRLPPDLSRPHHLRLAEDALAPLLDASHALHFQLPGPCFAVTWRGSADAALLEVLRALDTLLADAPSRTPPLAELVYLYDLPQQAELLLQAISGSTAAHEETPLPAMLPPLGVEALDDLETTLARADVARFARRQPVWRLGNGPATLAWEKRTLCVPELMHSLLPDYDVRGDPWLFRRLTRMFDRRMLALLASPGELTGVRPFALDLNINSVLSHEFLRFDAALPAPLRGRVTIELLPQDIMAEPAGFVFARGFARSRGYRIMLRNANPALLCALSLDGLELDNIQLRWTAGLAETPPERLGALWPGRTVLFRADRPAALEWGARAGIRLFQGAAADALGLGERSNAA